MNTIFMNKRILHYSFLLFMLCVQCSCSKNMSVIPTINLNESASAIRSNLLKITPIGIHCDKAKQILTQYQNAIPIDKNRIRLDTKYFDKYPCHMPIYNLGTYHKALAFTTTVVHATWIFDSNDNLKDIKVTKSFYGL